MTVEHRLVDAGFDGYGNWQRCSCGWEGGPFEGHKMLPPNHKIYVYPELPPIRKMVAEDIGVTQCLST